MKSHMLLIPILAVLVNSAMANQDTMTGLSVIKLNDSENGNRAREIRDAVVTKDKEIFALDRQIEMSRSQALSYRGIPGTNDSLHLANLTALTSAYELQKSELTSQREQLLSELTAQE